MNNILKIRRQFGLSQKEFGDAIGVTQGNVSHYEQGHQDMPPSVARRLIEAARERDLAVTWDDIYGDRRMTTANDRRTTVPRRDPHTA